MTKAKTTIAPKTTKAPAKKKKNEKILHKNSKGNVVAVTEKISPTFQVFTTKIQHQMVANTVKLIKLTRDNKPVGYVAFRSNDEGNIEVTIATKNPKDKWKHKLGHKIAVNRFTNPKNRILLVPKSKPETFEDTRRAVLDCLSTTDARVCDKARKAATAMLHELNGDSVRSELKHFLSGSAGKVAHKAKLVQSILDELIKEAIPTSKTARA